MSQDYQLLNQETNETQPSIQSLSSNFSENTSKETFTIEKDIKQTKTQKWCDLIWIFVSSMFITIAIVLGISMLALPARVGESGYSPFITTFTLCVIAQIFSICFTIEILQKTQAHMKEKYKDLGEDTSIFISKGPSFADVGETYLWLPIRILFDVTIIVNLVAILIAYTLGGSTSFSQVFTLSFGQDYMVSPQAVMPFFVLIFSLTAIFGYSIIRGILSTLTGIKVLFLLVVIFSIGALSAKLDVNCVDQWQYIGRPFLIGTTTLANAVSLLPMLYGKIEPTKHKISSLRAGAVTGMIIAYILASLWTYFILKSVPQYSKTGPSLEQSRKLGELVTIPLVKIITKTSPEFRWLAIIITIFIIFSLSVSFLAISTALKQQLDGYVKAFKREMNRENSYINLYTKNISNAPLFLEMAMYISVFVFVLIIAVTNANALLIVMERVVSLCVNFNYGIIVCSVFWIAKLPRFKVEIPLPMFPYLSDVFNALAIVFFSTAILWDIITMLVEIWIPSPPF